MPKSFTLGSRVLTRERLQRQATEAVVESRFRFRALHSAGGGALKGRCPSTSEVLRHCNGAVVVHDHGRCTQPGADFQVLRHHGFTKYCTTVTMLLSYTTTEPPLLSRLSCGCVYVDGAEPGVDGRQVLSSSEEEER